MAVSTRKRSPFDAESFQSTYTIGSFAEMPILFTSEPCQLGIDEAGRGPVSGPMVYSICYSPLALQDRLEKMGFADSKQLTEEERDKLFDDINRAPDVLGWAATVLQPQDISAAMLRRTKYNLNLLSHDTSIALVQDALDRGVRVEEVYVDTVGDPTKYQAKLANQFPSIRKIVVTSKADALFPIVSAASICAKVTRDRVLRTWEFEEIDLDVQRTFGSGYPHDDVTVAWLNRHFDPVFGFPSIVRFSWSTAARMIEASGTQVDWPVCPEDETTTDEALKGVPKLFEFFATGRIAARTAKNDDCSSAPKRRKATPATSIQLAMRMEPLSEL